MWNRDLIEKTIEDIEIPDDFKIPIPKFNNDIIDKMDIDNIEEDKMEEDKIEEDTTIDEIVNKVEKMRISSIFEKYIPTNDWNKIIKNELSQDYFKTIENKFTESIKKEIIYPKKSKIFRAFTLTPINKIKVVIIGQDPYPGKCRKTNVPYANGLAFSVNKECSIPKSLNNMYKEMDRSGFKIPKTGELEKWAKQGVFLINTQLSVEAGNANSHKFWQKFTDVIIKKLSEMDKKIVFVLMGGNALKKYKIIKKCRDNKFVITSHPSPLSFKKKLRSYPPFYGSNIFVNINNKLQELGLEKINW